MKLNCDLGEGLDQVDTLVMPLIDMASIACGGHTGDNTSMSRAVELALRHQVTIGAHPSYPDKPHFGRTSLDIPLAQLSQSIIDQIEALLSVCSAQQATVEYIKPHGALYNDLISDTEKRQLMFEIAAHFRLPLVLLARADNKNVTEEARRFSVDVIFEAFADRAYTDAGQLVQRKLPHSVHQCIEDVIAQACSLKNSQTVISETGKAISVKAETLCVHSDSVNAVESIKKIREALE